MHLSVERVGIRDRCLDGIKGRLVKWKLNITILSAYTILSIIFTYPVAFFGNKIPGVGDVFWFLWDLWWFKTALLSSANPYYTDYIFYPYGVSLAFSEVTPFNAIVSIPLQLVFGLVNTYNLIWISTFILSGYGTFLLVKYLTHDPKAAFISGLIFMFCPYRFAHALGHLNLISTEWMPLYILFLIKVINENGRINAIYAALFLFLTTLCSYYYLIYLIGFTVLYIIYYQIVDKNLINKYTAKKICMIVVPFGFAVLPFVYPIIKELFTAGSNYMYYGRFIEYSADLIGFFIPSLFHPLFRDLVSPIYSTFTCYEAEYIVFTGYTVLILSIIAYFKIKTKEVKFWTISAVIFFILCLGPVLHIKGIFNVPYEGYDFIIPLPYAILMHIPIFSLARAPCRWDVLVMLSLAILSGYALNYIFHAKTNFLNKINKGNSLFILFSCLILFEFLSIPYPIAGTTVPTFYEQIAKEPEDYAVLEIPDFFFVVTYSEYMYYQTIHEKKLINGYVSRNPDYVVDFIDSTPYIRQLMYLSHPSIHQDILNQNLTEIGPTILNYYNIKYIILHKELMDEEQFNSANAILQRCIKEDPAIYEHNTKRTWKGQPYSVNDTMIVYEVKKQPLKTFIPSNEGWHHLENWDGTATRWMSDDATLMIYSDENRTADLSFQALSFYRPRTLEIYVNDLPHIWAEVPTEGFVMVKAPPISLNEGANIIRFQVPEGCERPCDIPELENRDSRCLSVAVQNVAIE